MTMDRPLRSLLFVPGHRADRFAKALAAGADAVVVDLEDAVPPSAKESAREAVAAWLAGSPLASFEPKIARDDDAPNTPRALAHAAAVDPVAMPLPIVEGGVARAGGTRAPRLFLRINGADSVWFDRDLALVGDAALDAVMVPKSEGRDVLARVRTAGARALVPLVETAVGFAQLREIAGSPGVERLAFGTIDFQVDLGMRDAHEDELLPFRLQFVLESRLASIAAPIDGVSTAIDDATRLAHDVHRARRLGFGGKLCIHPRQVAQVNALFAPDETEIAWAKRVLDAAEAAGGAAVAVDGKMVDKPVMLRAGAILREAGLR
ncbi:MAG: CoA ester lyase [Burkholderiaceae bacterium]|nr:CoA ester lyase [Burkholderiaceae bacterium]